MSKVYTYVQITVDCMYLVVKTAVDEALDAVADCKTPDEDEDGVSITSV